MVVNKVVIGAVIIASLVGSATPAFADTTNTGQNVDNTPRVEQSYTVNIEQSVYNINETLNLIEEMKSADLLNQAVIDELATQISELDQAVTIGGSNASDSVIAVIQRAEAVLSNLDNTVNCVKAEAVIIVAKTAMGIQSEVVETKVTQAEAAVKNFPDVTAEWQKDWVYNLAGRGAIAGYPDGTFGPDKAISRGEFIKIAISTVEDGSFYKAFEGEHWANGMLTRRV